MSSKNFNFPAEFLLLTQETVPNESDHSPNPPSWTHWSLQGKHRSPGGRQGRTSRRTICERSCPGIDAILFQVSEDLADRFSFGDKGENLHLTSTVRAGECYLEDEA